MLADALQRQSAAEVCWHHPSPGVESCTFVFKQARKFSPSVQARHYEALFCMGGTLTVEKRDGSSTKLGGGDVLLTGAIKNVCTCVVEPPFRGVLVAVDAGKASQSLAEMAHALGGMQLDTAAVARLLAVHGGLFFVRENVWSRAVLQALDGLSADAGCAYAVWKTMELLYLCTSMQDALLAGVTPQVPVDTFLARTVADASIYMAHHLDEHHTIPALAHRFGVSQTAFKNEFRRLFDKPVRGWLQEMRMRRAATLLTETSLSVIDIAQEVGYESTSQFSAVFARFYGESPGRFRKKMSDSAHS